MSDVPPPYDGRSIPAHVREETWLAPDGHVIRRIDWPQQGSARGALLFAPGRGDCYEKYLVALHDWHAQGWHVTALDWRGQALSGRLGADEFTGHVDDFGPWVADLVAFWETWKASVAGPHVCIGHSMGGHLVLRTLAEHRLAPDAAVLIAPMLGLNPGWVPSRVLHPLGRIIAGRGDARRPAWTAGELPLTRAEGRMALLTHDETRFADQAWWYEQRPGLRTGAPSWGWIVAALASIRRLEQPGLLEAVDLPVLILGTSADRLVSWRAIRRAAARLPRAELVAFGPEARHEILRETAAVRQRALDAIADFLDRHAPARA